MFSNKEAELSGNNQCPHELLYTYNSTLQVLVKFSSHYKRSLCHPNLCPRTFCFPDHQSQLHGLFKVLNPASAVQFAKDANASKSPVAVLFSCSLPWRTSVRRRCKDSKSFDGSTRWNSSMRVTGTSYSRPLEKIVALTSSLGTTAAASTIDTGCQGLRTHSTTPEEE